MRRLSCFAIFAATFLFCLPTVAKVFQDDGSNAPDTALGATNVRRNRFAVTGDVVDDATGEPIQRLQINIRGATGQTSLTTMTDEKGAFAFNDLPTGIYTVMASMPGFQPSDKQVDISFSSALDVRIRLHKVSSDGKDAGSAGTRISAHELKAPSKAREAKDKGLQLLNDKSDYAGSIREFQKAIAAFPDYYEAYALMGKAYMGLKDSANAESALRKSVDLSGQQYAQPCLFLASLFSDNRRFSDAEPMARKALELDPNSWQANSELARALVGENQIAEGEKSAQEAVRLRPEEPELYLALINIHNKLHNYSATLDDINAYLKLAPNGRASEQVRNMRTQLQQALAKTPANPAQAQEPASDPKP